MNIYEHVLWTSSGAAICPLSPWYKKPRVQQRGHAHAKEAAAASDLISKTHLNSFRIHSKSFPNASKITHNALCEGSGAHLGASWERLWHRLGPKTPLERDFGWFWMDSAFILGVKTDRISIKIPTWFLRRFWKVFCIDLSWILKGFGKHFWSMFAWLWQTIDFIVFATPMVWFAYFQGVKLSAIDKLPINN